MSPLKIRLAHSPDSDDAFMFYGLASGQVPSPGLEIEHVLVDIETLNREALLGTYEVTAISFHAYPHVAERYALMGCGGSIGDGYGPLLVARDTLPLDRLQSLTAAVPGTLTSAYLALKLALPQVQTRVVPFDQILEAVAAGDVDLGLIIHEGQLTFADQGLVKLLDLGAWWREQTALPLPLGGNAVRRDLGPELMARLTRLVRDSVRCSLEQREAALAHAMRYARGMAAGVADRFVGMWVNDQTLAMDARSREAVRLFLERGAAAGLVPPAGVLDFVEP